MSKITARKKQKPKLEECILNKTDGSIDMFDGDWVQHGETGEFKTKSGLRILYSQNNSKGGPYGLVFGFVASQPYHPRGTGVSCRAVKVRLLTTEEKKKHYSGLRRRLIGHLDFW